MKGTDKWFFLLSQYVWNLLLLLPPVLKSFGFFSSWGLNISDLHGFPINFKAYFKHSTTDTDTHLLCEIGNTMSSSSIWL